MAQRHLGNALFQRISVLGAPRLQRACACGGTCADCAEREEEPRLQTKLTVGPPGDRYEREADRVADTMMRMSTADVREQPQPSIQRLQSGLRTPGHASLPGGALPGDGARPLSAQTRSYMEPRFGADFSSVRVHTGAAAERAASRLRARAFTYGHDIWLGRGARESDHRLMAHELTHVVQQGHSGGPKAPTVQRQAASGTGTAPPAPSTPSLGGFSEEMVRQIARNLRNAMAGPGTDEDAIYAAFAGRTQEQVDAVERVYNDMFGRSLSVDLQEELTESELRQLAVFGAASAGTVAAGGVASSAGGTPVTAQTLAEMVAERLHRAMDRIGTDEDAIFAALTGRTADERRAISAAYERLAGHTLEYALRDELSGSDLTRALSLMQQGMLEPADELYLAMRGAGTDEDTLFRVLDALAGDEPAIRAMETSYRSRYGDLITHLRDDLTADEYERAMAVLSPVLQDVDFQDCATNVIPEVRSLIPVGIRRVERAITVLSRGWAGMSAPQQAVFNRFYDPSNTGGVDEGFVRAVLQNFRLIRREFDDDLTVECETAGGLCTGGRLYYTYWSNIHVCPYFMTETDATRKARDFVHELAHNAMYAVDRPYYSASAGAYPEPLTPRGPAGSEIPLIGPLIRVISRTDTLYHPDAYSWFAFSVP